MIRIGRTLIDPMAVNFATYDSFKKDDGSVEIRFNIYFESGSIGTLVLGNESIAEELMKCIQYFQCELCGMDGADLVPKTNSQSKNIDIDDNIIEADFGKKK